MPTNLAYLLTEIQWRERISLSLSQDSYNLLMKWHFIISSLVLAPAYGQTGDTTCSIGSYNYTGAHFSDAYEMKFSSGLAACHERKAIDAVKLGEEHKTNRQLIQAQIEQILSDRNCMDIHETVTKYLAMIQKHKERFEAKQTNRIAAFKSIEREHDMQRDFAHFGAYSTTCAGEQNRESAFIDLDYINKIIPPLAPKTFQVQKNGEVVQDCSDVMASGSDDLKSFAVSFKKAVGNEFTFFWDPYGIPDQVILKSGGSVIYDSGCRGSAGREEAEKGIQKIPLTKLNSAREVMVDVINNCESPDRQKGVSAWEMNFKCLQEAPPACEPPKLELVRLLKIELELYKKFLDMNAAERQCFVHYDEDVLNDLIEKGLIKVEGLPMVNGICDLMDDECHARQAANRERDVKVPPAVPEPVRLPSAEAPIPCPEKPGPQASLLELISWNYCSVGKKRLGLE